MARDHGHLREGAVMHSDRGAQGGFKWSSQHLDRGGVQRWPRSDPAGSSPGKWCFCPFLLPPAAAAVLMSLSTIVVALNAQLLRRIDLDPAHLAPTSPKEEHTDLTPWRWTR
ncbi:hypothetical protein EKI51_10670 [Corynebacterium sanguinis]|nr:hypothetical protein EKI51_10670 [Corynebacterium sanguinis]